MIAKNDGIDRVNPIINSVYSFIRRAGTGLRYELREGPDHGEIVLSFGPLQPRCRAQAPRPEPEPERGLRAAMAISAAERGTAALAVLHDNDLIPSTEV
ncbi:hypothetical protein ATO13_22456 [Stappia sp. 22II-S9-Z10]|nr:hypothetical protein ATO13_22456 [Stappia sp. 22II-S9-Z10]